MARKTIEETVSGLVFPIMVKNAFELVDVEFVKEGSSWYLRVYIDKPGGITLDDCQAVSEELSDELDRADPIKQHYFLEVSSPGLERPLKTDRDFERYSGERVEVKVYQPIDGQKAFEGALIGLKGSRISIKTDQGRLMEFDREKVALVKKVIKF